MTPPDPDSPLGDVDLLLGWCRAGTDALRDARDVVNRLNVFPVADSDTGTNLHLTMEGATAALGGGSGNDAEEAVAALARGALVSARGNSGSILAQLIRTGGRAWVDAQADEPGVRAAEALAAAARGAYGAVATPVEGTMLTVMLAAADAAVAATDTEPGVGADAVVRAAAQAAAEALVRTSDQLDVLRRAGVVDAGGQGLCVLLDVLADLVAGGPGKLDTERLHRGRAEPARSHHIRQPAPGDAGPAYEVIYLLEATAADVETLRRRLDGLGSSLVVVGGEGLWNVHVHVDDAGAAVEAGVEVGRPYRIRVAHFAEQDGCHRHVTGRDRAVIACAAGPGVVSLLEEAGAVAVPVGPGRRVTASTLLQAALDTDAHEVVLLPNEEPSIATAESAADAARTEGRRVAVIPTRSQVQGLAAIAVRDEGLAFDDEVAQMSAAAGHARSGALTIATKDAMTMAGPCREGQCLGVVDGDFAVVGDDPEEVGRLMFDRISAAGGELVTVLAGCPDSAAGRDVDAIVEAVTSYAEQRLPLAEVLVLDGGQRRYPVLVGVE